VLLPAEALAQRFRPEGKDALDVPPDKQAVVNEVEPNRVTHVIVYERAEAGCTPPAEPRAAMTA
jgi:hypothetical protein